MSDALNRLTASVTAFIDTVAANNSELADIAAALRATAAQPSVNPEDTAALTGLADRLDAATAAAKAAGEEAKSALVVTVSVSPTSITGASGPSPTTGSFSAGGGTGPYSFTGSSDDVSGFAVDVNGAYAIAADAPVTVSATVTATDANGVSSAPTSVTISIG